MKFCVKCGTKLKDNDIFCPKCGCKFGLEGEEKAKSEFQENFDEFEEDDKFISGNMFDKFKRIVCFKKNKIGIIVVSILCIALISFFLIGNAMSKPADVVSKFQSSIVAGDKAQLVDILYCSDNRLKIDQKSIEPLINYLKDNPSYLNDVISQLNNEIVKSNENKDILKMNEFNSKSKFDVVYVGKKYLFFKYYKIGIKPSFISVKTGVKDVQFSLNNNEIAKSDSKDFSKQVGPFIPGKYKVNANYKGKYESLNESRDVDLIDSNENNISIEVFKDLSYVNINSQYPDAEIFVNNKDTGVKSRDANNFGPLSANSVIYGIATINGHKLRSSDYVVRGNDNYVSLDFTQSQSNMQIDENRMRNLVYWYTYYFTQAVNSGDFKSVEDYLYPGSSIYNEQQSYVTSTYQKGIKEEIKSFNIGSYNISADNKSGTVSTDEIYNIYQNNSSVPTTKTFHYTYTFMYNEEFQGYQISSLKSN